MYIHPAFQIGYAKAHALLRERGFGTLIVGDATGRPLAVHLPFLTHKNPDGGFRMEFHVAKANNLHELMAGDGRSALLTCQGPDAYISPDWYGVPDQVPTWPYIAVHLSGRVYAMPEADRPAHLDRLSAEFENRLRPKRPWTADKMDPVRRAAATRAIVPLNFIVPSSGVEAQSKLIQHKGMAEHHSAIRGLRARGDAGSVAIADLMADGLKQRDV